MGDYVPVVDRLSPLDASFLYMEEPTTAMHVGAVLLFDAPPGPNGEGRTGRFEYDELVRLIGDRLPDLPRYRQKVKEVPGHLGSPVWVDDNDFDLSFHVRRSALPRPGSMDQLRELTGRLMSRRLDRGRPLWEIYVVEGLADGRTAIINKTHHAMVDGIAGVDLLTVLFDVTAMPRETEPQEWRPAREPSGLSLVASSVASALRQPALALDSARSAISDVRATADKVVNVAGGIAATLRTSLPPAPSSPLNTRIGEQRRYGMAATDLDDYKRIRKEHGGTVNDVVLAVVGGALRAWLLARGEPVTPATTVRAMVPVSVRAEADKGGNRVAAYFVDLPVGEPSAALRLQHVSYAMKAHKENNQSVGADSLIALGGFAPPNLFALGARVTSSLSRRVFNLVVTNVPGPQFPLYAAGAHLESMYPVVPLAKGQAVCIGVMSYDGGVYYGLNADRDAMPDVDILAQCLAESVAELLETVH